ncbi:class I mannose-6-phosphate isomerase [Microbacterium sp. C23T]
MTLTPVRLPFQYLQHNYRGGARIAALRGADVRSDYQPEEWLGSTVTRFGDPTSGLAVTEEGTMLRDVISSDANAWIGSKDGDTLTDTGMLVKLLDPAQRLPVHVHPDRSFAAQHLDCPYGKTEAWYILDADPGSAVYLGWREPVDPDELARARDAQDSEWMLQRLNRIPVEPGMGIFVPAGTAHAIDSGVFVLEVQEPTDWSILLEWSITTATRDDSHIGVGWNTVMGAVSTSALGVDELAQLIRTGPAPLDIPARGAVRSVLPSMADPFFRILDVTSSDGGPTDSVTESFAVALIAAGDGELFSEAGSLPARRGDVVAVPHGFGSWQFRGHGRALVCLPGAGWPATLKPRPAD